MDEVRRVEASAAAGGPGAVNVIGNSLRAIDRAVARAERAEARVAALERDAWWVEGRVNEYERRIAALEAERRVAALEVRQARRDRWWVVAVCAVGLLLVLALAIVTGGPPG